MLESLPGWSWDTVGEAWEMAYGALLEFIAREGHARVPASHAEGRFALGTWVAKQRALHKRGQLEPERSARLDSTPGWAWSKYEAEWRDAFGLLGEYMEREGDCQVPWGHTERGHKLGIWVAQQRRSALRGTLPVHRRELLNSMPGWSW